MPAANSAAIPGQVDDTRNPGLHLPKGPLKPDARYETGDAREAKVKASRMSKRLFAAVSLVIVVPCVAAMVRAQAPEPPDPADIAAGMRIFRSKADCQTCHGWAGDGRKMDTQMPDGANLRPARLKRTGFPRAIRWGRPGRESPVSDRLPYSEGRCNNLKPPDLQRLGLELPEPAATLQPREIEQVT